MKNLILILSLIICITVDSQTIVFHENFELPSLADSVSISSAGIAANQWAISTQLASQGLRSDSCTVSQSDTSYLTTVSFSTLGNSDIGLQFSHICKIGFFNAAEIYVSANNGVNWTKLTGIHYLGSGNFNNIGSKFTSTSYGIDWNAGNNSATPNNNWWKTEQFDISSIAANSANVKIRFQLSDMLNVGSTGNYGWLIDDIKVLAAFSELLPPSIQLAQPIINDSVYHTGPFDIYATIIDSSGIDSAMLIYTLNNGTPDTVGMINTFGNTYFGQIDTINGAFSIGDTFCYYIYAVDASPASNIAKEPSLSCNQFVVYYTQLPPGCTSPLSNFPYYENFDSAIAGSGSSTFPGVLPLGWTRNQSSGNGYMMLVNNGPTNQSNSGPDYDHTTGIGNYIYSSRGQGIFGLDSASLVSPCFDITNLTTPQLEFYYHMYGASIISLSVDIWCGSGWVRDIWIKNGQQQTTSTSPWERATVDLNPYKSVTKIRFRCNSSSYTSNIAIDDVKIWKPSANDAGVIALKSPISSGLIGTKPVKVSIKNFGLSNLTSTTINWDVNGTLQTPFNWTGLLAPLGVANSIQIGTYNFNSGEYIMKFWTSSPNGSPDEFTYNDTFLISVIFCNGYLKGEYTVGSVNSDFTSIKNAVIALYNCGIDSAVVFNIAPGIYKGELAIPFIIGSSNLNTITFQSSTGDSTDVIIQNSAFSLNILYVVKFDSASHIIFRNLTIKTDNNGITLLHMQPGSYHNTFENNVFECVYGSTDGYCIYSKNCDYNVFRRNYIRNGDIAVYMLNTTYLITKRNVFENNIIEGFHNCGLCLYNQDSVIVKHNIIENGLNYNYLKGIYLSNCDGNIEVIGNTIKLGLNQNGDGISINLSDGNIYQHGIVANNMVSILGGVQSGNGIYCNNSKYQELLFNTIYLDSVNSTSKSLHTNSGSTLTIQNNICVNNSGGYAFYCKTPSAVVKSDYNNYFSSDTTNFAYYGNVNVKNLAVLKSLSGKEIHSKSILPSFFSKTNLHLGDYLLGGSGCPVSGITSDIDENPRSIYSPTIGCDELNSTYDAGICDVIMPNMPRIEGCQEIVTVRIFNNGSVTLTSIPIHYSISSTTIVSETYNGQLLPGSFVDYSFNSLMTIPLGRFNICAYTTLTQDYFNNNDTIYLSVKGENKFTSFYFDDFDGKGPNDFIKSGFTCWEQGIPAANVINLPHSSPNVWATNLDGSHLNTSFDELFTPYFNFKDASALVMRFYHWYDSEIHYDGGTIQYKYLGQSNWESLGTVGDTNGVNWYNSYNQSLNMWDGSSGGWNYSSYDLSQFDYNIVPVQFKFAFRANMHNPNMYDGWAIDDFQITAKKINIDAGIDNILYPDNPGVIGANVKVKVVIKNFGFDTLYSIPVSYRKDNGITINEIWTGKLFPDDTVQHTFNSNFLTTASYDLYTWTSLLGDINKFNDTTYMRGQMVGVEEINNEFYLNQNKPNPSNDKTIIEFSLPNSGHINFKIADIFGRELFSESKFYPTGKNQIEIDVSKYSAGVYYYSIEFEKKSLLRKMVVY
ncbi:MAG: T9SS type A sorting domain-containing protein [Saprospiraceae bacterium]|nr:T9SS type A sorting domain-containing protein [Saprospiraceae bacterium]